MLDAFWAAIGYHTTAENRSFKVEIRLGKIDCTSRVWSGFLVHLATVNHW